MTHLNLVTGANGHLGNNLVRILLEKGVKVKGSVRDANKLEPFEGLDLEIVFSDLMNKELLSKALKGVHTLYHCAAVFRHWAEDPDKEILLVNRQGTQNVMEAAAEQGVKKIIYVSSIVALDYRFPPMDETRWNINFANPYNHAKTESEQLAWELAKKHNLDMVTVLPSAIVGPNIHGHLTPTMNFLDNIINSKIMADTCFNFNYIDVRDVAVGMMAAAEKGRSGERYILGNERYLSCGQTIEIARSVIPNITKPPEISKEDLMKIAIEMERQSKLTKEAPLITSANVNMYYKVDVRLDISKARKELKFHPRSPETAIKETVQYLYKRK